MELYGSLHNISGSVTASAFSGSFKGDGGGLYNLPASGVTGLNLSQIASGNATASISSTGFTVNTNTTIQGNLSVTGSITATNYIVSSSVTYMTTSFASGSSAFGNDNNDVHQFTGSVQITGSISLNGQAIGTGKLDETVFQSYTSSNDTRVLALETSSGSLNSFTSSINTTIKSKLDSDGVISGSIQVVLTGTTGYSTFSSSISTSIADVSSSVATTTSNLSSSIATTDLNQSNRLNSIEGKTGSYATTGSNLFIGTQTHSGSILPSVDNTYDLGSATHQWRDVYISSGSLYIDGTKVISSTAQELTITTDTGQSIKILESTTDSIILQVADGDIELKSSGDGDILLDPTNGKIMLKGTVEILNGQKIQSSVGGTPVVFANDIVVSGSIDITGTIEGINLTDFSSSVNTRVSNLESGAGSLNSFTASANNRLNSLESTSGSLNTFTSSATSRLSSIETTTGSLNSYTSSNNTRLSSIETTTSSILGVNTTQNGRLDSLETTSGSILTTNTAQGGRLDSIEGKSGSYATTGSNIFQGDQTITGSLYVSQNLIIAGSSSIQNISSSVLNIADNIITVNAINPSVRFGGLAVIDSGSSPQVSGSMLFDSVNNQWLFVHQNQGTVTSSVLLMGPETYNNLGNETYITSNRLVKSTGIENLTNSNISDDGTTVTILSNAVVNGTFSATGTTLVSGSSQITHDSTTGYVANRHIDHSAVSISAGNGLSGGGDISTTRTITLDTASATFTSGVKSKMSADGVVSGSSQVSFNGITDKPTLVSGSSQITYGSLSSIPAGIVSGSSQITFGSISSIPSGLVSGSSQIDLTSTTNYSTGIKTRLNAEGVISGSAQVAYGSITGVPSGLVSGSAQITLSSTSGFGSYLNQAVLTTSSPTFAGGTINGSLYVNANADVTTLAGSLTLYSTGNATTSMIMFKNTTGLGYGNHGAITGTYNTYFVMDTTDRGWIFRNATTSGNVASISNTGVISATTFVGVLTGNATTAGSISGFNNPATAATANTIAYRDGSGDLYARYFLGGYVNTSDNIDTGTITHIMAKFGDNYHRSATAAKVQSFLGLGSMAYASTSSYLPLAGGTMTGKLTINGQGFGSNEDSLYVVNKRGGFYPLRVLANEGDYQGVLFEHTNGSGSGGPGPSGAYGFKFDDQRNNNYSSHTHAASFIVQRSGAYAQTDIFAVVNASSEKGLAVASSGTVTMAKGLTVTGDLLINGSWSTSSPHSYSEAFTIQGTYPSMAFRSTTSSKMWLHHMQSDGALTWYHDGGNYTTENWAQKLQLTTNGTLYSQSTGDLGTSTYRWGNVYTNDLHLSNEGKEGGNDVDGTTGDWTIQEGEENLYIINNKNGKKFKMDLTEIV